MSLAILIITGIYLFVQSYYDLKYMKVPVYINNIMLYITVFLYCIDTLILKLEIIDIVITITVIIILYIMNKIHMYGSGDFKALEIIFLNLRYITNQHVDNSIFLLLLIMLIANIILIIFHKFITNKEINKQKRVAYFPCLTIGYMITLTLGGNYFG